MLGDRQLTAAGSAAGRGEYAMALEKAKSASAYSFRQTRYELALIDSYANTGDLENARLVASRVLHSSRFNGGITPAIARLLVGVGDPLGAMEAMEGALRNDPFNQQLKTNLGDLYSAIFEFARDSGDERLGELVLDKARSLDPSLIVSS